MKKRNGGERKKMCILRKDNKEFTEANHIETQKIKALK